ncbi:MULTISPECIES: NAD-dependent epimerase/dehydratase family protein [unclassified Microbacterium]|uniref:NAD-dependent epimerase/dehydratase family protein n=1 Tax=unclassified Microbacterium TaxID=2609290 RepID=UPI00097F1557|nr:NAD(P)-dependent oxidoreductase [Microbacterium sp. JB110]RCS57766.1 NAD(P)-dependent oxidoreductase [Microbacterium sp. JB110]SJM67933.1 UDP-glucose 4-epimerase [Frigoribacterium sp. JB110]
MTGGLRVALTGAAGSLAADVIPGLLERGHRITAIDERPLSALPEEVRTVECSITDREELAAAVASSDVIVHLAGIPLEAPWQDILAVNVDGTQAILEAARIEGISRVVLASSIHAAGFVPVPPEGEFVPDDVAARPDTFYGASKAMLESLGALYNDRHGIDVVCLRIASRFPRPMDERMLSTWLSPDDATRLVHASLMISRPGYRLVWGVSANSAGYLSPRGGRAIGYEPQDDAAVYASALAERSAHDQTIGLSEWERRFIGGEFCSAEPPRFIPFAEREQS